MTKPRLILAEKNSQGINFTTELFNEEGEVSVCSGMNKVPNYAFSFLDEFQSEGYIGADLKFLVLQGLSKEDQHATVARILGKMAEALLVSKCNQDCYFNRFYSYEGRLAQKREDYYLDRYEAVGTGLKRTKDRFGYRRHYNPNDTQKDIIWVDKNNLDSVLTTPKRLGHIPAGLQLKLSYNFQNIANGLSQYYYPIVYFDMNNDFKQLKEYIIKKQNEEQMLNRLQEYTNYQWAHVRLVEENDFNNAIKEELKWFEKIMIKLLNNQITIQKIIDMSKRENMTDVAYAISQNAVDGSYGLYFNN